VPDLEVDHDERSILEAIASLPEYEANVVGMTEDRIMGRVGMSLATVRSLLGILRQRGLLLTGPANGAPEGRWGFPIDASRLTAAGKEALKE
jgi:hypothetical protein